MSSGGGKKSGLPSVDVKIDVPGFGEYLAQQGTQFLNNANREITNAATNVNRDVTDLAQNFYNNAKKDADTLSKRPVRGATDIIGNSVATQLHTNRSDMEADIDDATGYTKAKQEAADLKRKNDLAELAQDEDRQKNKAMESAARLRARQRALFSGAMGRQGTISVSPLTNSLGTSPTGKNLLGE